MQSQLESERLPSRTNLITIDRPDSSQLVDLHVYTIPKNVWKDRQNLAENEAMEQAISAGFVRVPPNLTIYELRQHILNICGHDDEFPKEFIYLRSVGRCLTKVKPQQETDLRVKNYRPPMTFAPEIYVLEGHHDDEPLITVTTQSFLFRESPINRPIITPSQMTTSRQQSWTKPITTPSTPPTHSIFVQSGERKNSTYRNGPAIASFSNLSSASSTLSARDLAKLREEQERLRLRQIELARQRREIEQEQQRREKDLLTRENISQKERRYENDSVPKEERRHENDLVSTGERRHENDPVPKDERRYENDLVHKDERTYENNYVRKDERRHENDLVPNGERRHENNSAPKEERRHENNSGPKEERRPENNSVLKEERRHENNSVLQEEQRHVNNSGPKEERRHENNLVHKEERKHENNSVSQEERRHENYSVSKDQQEKEEAAVIQIQAAYRGYRDRRDIKQQQQQQLAANEIERLQKEARELTRRKAEEEHAEEIEAHNVVKLSDRLEELKKNRIEVEAAREAIVRRMQQLHAQITVRRKEERDLWKQKYLNEKKKTTVLEDRTRMGTRNQIDINTQVEQTKVRLTNSTKLRQQAENECHLLRQELQHMRLSLNSIDKQPVPKQSSPKEQQQKQQQTIPLSLDITLQY